MAEFVPGIPRVDDDVANLMRVCLCAAKIEWLAVGLPAIDRTPRKARQDIHGRHGRIAG